MPINSSQYSITLKNYWSTELPTEINPQRKRKFSAEIITYNLESKEGKIEVTCTFQDNIMSNCLIISHNDSVNTDRDYISEVDLTKTFLEKYQDYTETDSQELIKSLSNVDLTKNTTITLNNLKLAIKNQDLSNTAYGNITNLHWTRIINGCEYILLDITLQNGFLFSVVDHRELYTIGNPTINISKKNAISIAMEYVKNYSYLMPDETRIQDFIINETSIAAELQPTTRENNTLYPYWSIMLHLNQTYPGGVYALLVGVWADTGEIIFCNNQAAGGIDLLQNDTSYLSVQPFQENTENSGTTSTLKTENNTTTHTVSILITTIAFVVLTIIVTATIIRKRKK
jgi:hypothetical protein